jgi:hypothetical protein
MTIGTPVYPGQSNTYIPNHAATAGLVIGFSRNVDDFPLNDYIQIKPVTKDVGYYLRLTTEEAGRVLSTDLSEFVWPDGADRPQNNDGTELFAFDSYRTQRFNYAFKLGDKSREQADWGVVDAHKAIKAQQAMTARTVRAHAILQSNSSWETGHRIAVDDIDGNTGPWDASTVTRQDIKRSLNHAAEQIMKSTLSVVKKKDLRLILDPVSAHRISEAQEIVDHIKGSPDAYSQVKGGEGRWSQYGLPDALYGFKVVVEDTVKVTSRRGAATASRDFVATPGTAYLLARPGGLVAPAGGGPNFSTICMFAFEEMSVEEFQDSEHRRMTGNIVDDFAMVQTASVSGFKFEDILTVAT